MEANKENNNRLKRLSKIPIPIERLPPVPKHLTLKYAKTIEERQRAPLETINYQDLVGTSTRRRGHASPPQTVDSRHVTIRKKSDNRLDWNYKVFKDESVLTISSDDDETHTGKYDVNLNVQVQHGISSKQIVKNTERPDEPIKPILPTSSVNFEPKIANPVQDTDTIAVNSNLEPKVASSPHDTNAKPVTPVKDTLEHNRVKNIKRSLKRPHSRELQLLASGRKERRSDDGPPTKLLIRGSLSERLKSLDPLNKLYSTQLTRNYTEDVFNYLIAVERRPCCKKVGIPDVTRACVLNWLMKVNGPNGDPAILQATCWYLDAMLAHKKIPIEKLQLVATACYWVAQKLYHPGLPASRLVKCSNGAFTASNLMQAEMVLLRRLNFPPQPVIPNDFITFLSSWCEPENPGEVEVAATFLCISGLLVSPGASIEYPSTVAAAAVRNAVLLIRKRDVMDRLLNCPVYKSAEAKTSNFQAIMSSQRVAARTVANARYDYKTPYHQFGLPPMYIAQKVVKAAFNLSMMDSINMLL